MRILETAVVSRKTAKDGKLEITKDTARRLGDPGSTVLVSVGGIEGDGTVVSMPCQCRGETNHAVHTFLESALLRSLPPESSVELHSDSDTAPVRVRVTPV